MTDRTPEDAERLKKFAEELGMDDELCLELRAHLETMEHFGSCIKHPLVFAVPYFGDAGRMNKMLAYKQKACDEYLEQEKWGSYIFMHERPHRLEAFTNVEPWLSDSEYWDLLYDIWVDTENAWQNLDEWQDLWENTRPGRGDIGDKLPREATFTIYRGTADPEYEGISWTLSYDKAKWFALRFRAVGYVMTTFITRLDVIMYTDRRNEQEVLIALPAAYETEEVRES